MASRRQNRVLAPAQKRVMRQVAKGVFNSNVETKIVSFDLGNVASATAGAVLPISQFIEQGDNINQRSGDNVKVTKLRLYVSFADALATSVLIQRIIVFSDSMANGALPAVTDVLEAATVQSGYDQINSQRNRFKIYADKMFDQVAGTHTGQRVWEHTVRCNKLVYFNAASGAASDGKGALAYLIITSQANALITHRFGCEIRFTDA
jgi:hypothetical protein